MAIEGVPVACGFVETPDPAFDPDAPANRAMVLVRKRGFSLNYRDRSFILSVALKAPPGSFCAVGSEFVGEVVACGPDALGLRPGDRVIADNAYPETAVAGVPGGIPGNQLSKELQVLHAAKLARIPASMPDDVAAGFAIGAQTCFSIVRRLELPSRATVLVAGGRSNTSLFAIAALRALGAPPAGIHVSTTSASGEALLRGLGATEVIRLDPDAPSFVTHPAVQRVLGERGGFDAVIDPFFDIHLVPAIPVLRPGGRYITCGFENQTGHLVANHRHHGPPPTSGLMVRVMLCNMSIMGNCLGTSEDLARAIAAHAAGQFPVVVDRVFSGDTAAGFLERTYNAADRFGKVVYLYR